MTVQYGAVASSWRSAVSTVARRPAVTVWAVLLWASWRGSVPPACVADWSLVTVSVSASAAAASDDVRPAVDGAVVTGVLDSGSVTSYSYSKISSW